MATDTKEQQDNELRDLISEIWDLTEFTPNIHDFSGAMTDIDGLIGVADITPYAQKHNQLLFANVITAIETYLYQTLVSLVAVHDTYRKNLITHAEEFKKSKFTLQEIETVNGDIGIIISEKLYQITWHNIGKAEKLYKAALGVDFPKNQSFFHKAAQIRHDIVHRNGMDKNGNEHLITSDDIRSLITDSERFVVDINACVLKKVKSDANT